MPAILKPHSALPFRKLVTISALVDGTAQIRSATFEGSDYIVVPVIALIGNSIIRPLNSLGPEFIPAEELAAAPGGWNGRPVLPDHPNNGLDSANSPTTLEQYRFGHLFNTRFESNKLKTEAWLSPSRAEIVGQDAVEVINLCQAGELVEISVGVFVALTKNPGTYNNESYEYIWRGIVPDHLAMGLSGSEGACSIEMGCGAPRAAKSLIIPDHPNSGAEVPNMTVRNDKNDKNKSIGLKASSRPVGLSRFMEAIKSLTSSNEIRSKLYDALSEVEPGLYWVEDYDADLSMVTYTTLINYPDYTSDLMWWQRTYKEESGNITLNEDRQQVEPTTTYKPVAASISPESIQAGGSLIEPDIADADPTCKCQNNHDNHNHKGATNMNRANVLKRLFSLSPFKSASDRKILESLSDDALTDLDQKYQAADTGTGTGNGEEDPSKKTDKDKDNGKVITDTTTQNPPNHGEVANVPVTPTNPAPNTPIGAAAANTKEPSEDEILARYPSLRSMVDGYKRIESTKRTALISALKSAQTVYSESQLQSRSTDDLEGMARMLKIGEPAKDFSGQGLFNSDFQAASSIDAYMPPDSYGLDTAKKTAN